MTEKEFRVMVVEFIHRMDEKINNLCKNQEEMKSDIATIKNTMESFNSRLQEAEDRISELEDQVQKQAQSEQQLKKKIKKQEESLRELRDNMKRSNMRIIGLPEGQEEQQGLENIFEEIMTENFPDMGKIKLRNVKNKVKRKGEIASADVEAEASYQEDMPKIMNEGGYTEQQIYNVDEIALYLKNMSSRTSIITEEKSMLGFKASKDRLTRLLRAKETASVPWLPEAFGRPGAPADSQPDRSPAIKGQSGDLAACLLRRKAFRKPPQRRRLSEGLGHRRTASRTGPPRSKAKAGDLAACLLRRKAFRKPPQRRRLSEGLGRRRTASRTGPPRSKAKAGDLAACLLRRKAFRKPPQRRRLSEGLGRRRTASRTGPPRSKAKAGDLAACLLRRKAFRKPPQRQRLSEGLGRLRTASRTGPPRSKAKAGDLAACLLRRKAFRKPPQRRRLSEGLGHWRTAAGAPGWNLDVAVLVAWILEGRAVSSGQNGCSGMTQRQTRCHFSWTPYNPQIPQVCTFSHTSATGPATSTQGSGDAGTGLLCAVRSCRTPRPHCTEQLLDPTSTVRASILWQPSCGSHLVMTSHVDKLLITLNYSFWGDTGDPNSYGEKLDCLPSGLK
ncbi:hypothetical protein QTO34_000579, partial [Cnephaeus nilssonii]